MTLIGATSDRLSDKALGFDQGVSDDEKRNDALFSKEALSRRKNVHGVRILQ